MKKRLLKESYLRELNYILRGSPNWQTPKSMRLRLQRCREIVRRIHSWLVPMRVDRSLMLGCWSTPYSNSFSWIGNRHYSSWVERMRRRSRVIGWRQRRDPKYRRSMRPRIIQLRILRSNRWMRFYWGIKSTKRNRLNWIREWRIMRRWEL